MYSNKSWLKITSNLAQSQISLNAEKTEFVVFRHHRKTLAFNPFLKIGGKEISQSSSIKYLGVLVDSHLNWKTHTFSLSSKLARANGIISKLKHYVSTKTLINVYYALFQSHLQYSFQPWGLIENTPNLQIYLHTSEKSPSSYDL